MIAVLDNETAGLDSRKLILSTFYIDDKNILQTTKPNEMKEHILKTALMYKARKQYLNIYGFNTKYDFYGIYEPSDPTIKEWSTEPFFAQLIHTDHWQKQMNVASFYDLNAIYRMSLDKACSMIGLSKLPMPESLKGTKGDCRLTAEIEQYNIHDCRITKQLLAETKKALTRMSSRQRRIISSAQIAIGRLLEYLRKQDTDFLFAWKAKSMFHTPKLPDIHRQAYRYPRAETFKLGRNQGVYACDCNSAYAYAATQIPCPDLRTETIIDDPTDITKWLDAIGVATISATSPTGLPFLPVRTLVHGHKRIYYPENGQRLAGTYTLAEIKHAISLGYKITACKQIITWKQAETNPFRLFAEEMYEYRKKAVQQIDKYLIKVILTQCWGKMAQNRSMRMLQHGTVDDAQYMTSEGWQIDWSEGINYQYSKSTGKHKSYRCIIIPAYINAYTRIHMDKIMRLIPRDELVYTDVDMIAFQGEHNLSKFQIGPELGEFKIQYQDEEAVLFAPKVYRIGKSMHSAGTSTTKMSQEEFDTGLHTATKMITTKSMTSTLPRGSFVTENRNLIEALINHEAMINELKMKPVLIDAALYNWQYQDFLN